MTEGAANWGRLRQALALLAVDPVGLGGLWVRARASPVRDRACAGLGFLPLPQRRLHPAIGDDALFGGLDLSATLSQGRFVVEQGLLAQPSVLVLTMAERCPPGLAARLAAVLDAGGQCLVALDEAAGPDETLPRALADRMAFQIDLEGLAWADTAALVAPEIKGRLADVEVGQAEMADLVRVAVRLGIDSLRAPLLALKAARANAALFGRNRVDQDDLTVAVELVFGPRATILPEPESKQEPEPPTPPEQDPGETEQDAPEPEPMIPEDILLEAVRALLPADLLARIAAGRAQRNAKAGSGAGAQKKGNRRGRPMPSRAGRLDGVNKIDLVATLRAAAPWQGLRRAGSPVERILHIRPADIRVRRYEEKSDRLLIFTVDASGSAAFARLAEAKGAVELLLAEAYSRRDHVALVAFRGTGAELLLPPTRSLVQTKRRLAGLPGGGGTPLAAGMKAALAVAQQARARGMTPTIALLTDGRANIALDGSASRAQAGEDALHMARVLGEMATPTLVIDMGVRAEPSLRLLAETLRGTYLALPRADARRLSVAVSAALET